MIKNRAHELFGRLPYDEDVIKGRELGAVFPTVQDGITEWLRCGPLVLHNSSISVARIESAAKYPRTMQHLVHVDQDASACKDEREGMDNIDHEAEKLQPSRYPEP